MSEEGRGRVHYTFVMVECIIRGLGGGIKLKSGRGLVCDYKVNRRTACESHKAQTHVILCAFCRLLVASTTNSEINARSAIQAARSSHFEWTDGKNWNPGQEIRSAIGGGVCGD